MKKINDYVTYTSFFLDKNEKIDTILSTPGTSSSTACNSNPSNKCGKFNILFKLYYRLLKK